MIELIKWIENLAIMKWLPLGLVLFTTVFIGWQDWRIGAVFLVFCIAAWLHIKLCFLISKTAHSLLNNYDNPKIAEVISTAVDATVLLGGFAAWGIVLRGDNFITRLGREHVPDGIGLSFIDPYFALIVIVGFTVYAWYRVRVE